MLDSDAPRLLGWPQSRGWHRVLSVGHEAEETGKGLSVDAVAPEAGPGGSLRRRAQQRPRRRVCEPGTPRSHVCPKPGAVFQEGGGFQMVLRR